MHLAATLLLAFGSVTQAQQCPDIHVFGARETTAAPGYGSSGALIHMIQSAHPGTTAEAIVYPACGGQDSCGGIQYGESARQGTNAVSAAVNSFHQRCPSTRLILVGYSQGGQIMDNALCGGGDPGAGISNPAVPISSGAVAQIKAATFMGDPRFKAGAFYNVGTCEAAGFDARPSGFVCPNGSKVQSYCDWQDPYCCTGNDAQHHQQYVQIYGQQAVSFINRQLSGENRC